MKILIFQGGFQEKTRMADSLGRFTETFACAFQISLKEMIWMAAPKAAKWEPSSPGASSLGTVPCQGQRGSLPLGLFGQRKLFCLIHL